MHVRLHIHTRRERETERHRIVRVSAKTPYIPVTTSLHCELIMCKTSTVRYGHKSNPTGLNTEYFDAPLFRNLGIETSTRC